MLAARSLRSLRAVGVSRVAGIRFASTEKYAEGNIPTIEPQQKIEHHRPDDPIPPPPPGVPIDPQLAGQNYPQLPEISLQLREPYGWWDMQERKNFNETYMENEDVLGMWGPDEHKMNPWKALGQLTLALSLFSGFTYLIAKYHITSPAIKREYPYDGLVKELGGANAANPEAPELDD